jgi:mono/diheme cytochrome c family protein
MPHDRREGWLMDRHGLAWVCGVIAVLAVVVVDAQQRLADQGVYTAAQAARGSRLFDTHCQACHRDPGGNAPVLVGDRFTRLFGDGQAEAIFTAIKTTMPRQAPGSLSDAEYVDVVAHLLRANGYPDGMSELALADLPGIRIPGTSGSLDQALVQVVGCLSRTGRTWTRTRQPEPASDEEAAQLDATPASGRSYRLQQVYGGPPGWTDQRVVAKGFLSDGPDPRITVTSLRTLTGRCQP